MDWIYGRDCQSAQHHNEYDHCDGDTDPFTLFKILLGIMAIVSILLAVGISALVGTFFELSLFETNIITMIGLAVGIDYSLFVLSRYREERSQGFDKIDAVGRAGSTAGRAVVFSGMTVVLALIGMLLIPFNIFISI